MLGFLSLVVGLAQWVLGRTVSESVFGQWCAMNGLMVKSVSLFGQWLTMNGLMVKCVRVCLWPMASNEWSDYEECQSLSLANDVQ